MEDTVNGIQRIDGDIDELIAGYEYELLSEKSNPILFSHYQTSLRKARCKQILLSKFLKTYTIKYNVLYELYSSYFA